MLNQSNEDRINYTYTKEELEMLFELDNYIKDNGGEGVLFREFLGIENEEDLDNAWTFNEVMYVNNNLDRMGVVGLFGCDPWVFMMQNRDRKNVALAILKNGWVRCTEDNFKHYLYFCVEIINKN